MLAARLLDPLPLRVQLARYFLRRTTSVSFEKRLRFDCVERPHYGFCMYHAATLAAALGQPKISVLEFGVGRGGSLLSAERLKKEIEPALGVEIDLYGFDLGSGLPSPTDYRDHPYMWQTGFYKMDVDELRNQLDTAELVIGNVADTTSDFFDKYDPAPIGAIFIDLDYYSSTMDALRLLSASPERFLPRVMMYFDDMVGPEEEIFHEYGGELLAICEFNQQSAERKIAKHHALAQKRRIPAKWNEQIFVFHCFDHGNYCDYVFPAEYRT